jgi:hypothetical protein
MSVFQSVHLGYLDVDAAKFDLNTLEYLMLNLSIIAIHHKYYMLSLIEIIRSK